eukprot:gb/GECG01002706.1/.p1 GENE.gb/GECG01002706.1/~~gb/GECG01002706.1/.p1  ORF type:complete len:605 (+),score=42.74 gb/GECG01002706.1/:1-1815(+)
MATESPSSSSPSLRRRKRGKSTSKASTLSTREEHGNDSNTALTQQIVTGGSLLVVLNVSQRVLAFVFNTLLVRHVSLRTYGWISNDMELLHNLILFVSREAIRKTALREDLRQEPTTSQRFQRVVGLSWISVILGIAGSLSWGLLYSLPYFEVSPTRLNVIWIYCFSAALESLAEPFVVLSHNLVIYEWQALAEIAGSITRGFLTYACFVWLDWGEMSFGCAQLMYAAALVIVYFICFVGGRGRLSDMLPRNLSWRFAWKELKDIMGFFLFHGVLTWVLSNGDRILLSSESSYEDKAVYAAAANYSGLVPRMIFSAMEEISRNMFTKMHSQVTEAKGEKQKRARSQELYTTFGRSLRLMSIVGLLFATFGPPYTHVLTRFLLGPRWANETNFPMLLGAFCAYMTVMSVNGIAEAFNTAIGNRQEVKHFTLRLLFLLVPYLACHYWFLQHYGSLGLVLAMSLQLFVRSLWAMKMAYFWFVEKSVAMEASSLLPSLHLVVVFAVSFVMCSISALFTYRDSTVSLFVPGQSIARTLLDQVPTDIYADVSTTALLRHLIVGVVCSVAVLLVFTYHEKELAAQIWDLLQRKLQTLRQKTYAIIGKGRNI